MDRTRSFSILLPTITLALMLTAPATPVSGQVSTACTSSLISSFTSCFNFLTGSTNGGGSPTAGCCQTLASLISSGTECVCLILTGNVPIFNLPINRTLALSLPKICNSSVPLQCTETAAPLPSAGAPFGYSPTLPPLPPFASVPSAPSLSPSSEPPPSSATFGQAPAPAATVAQNSPMGQGINQGQSRPIVLPSSAVRQSLFFAPAAFSSMLMLAAMVA